MCYQMIIPSADHFQLCRSIPAQAGHCNPGTPPAPPFDNGARTKRMLAAVVISLLHYPRRTGTQWSGG